jgi:hypothetical protein
MTSSEEGSPRTVWLKPNSTRRRWLIAIAIYAVTTSVFAIFAGDRMLDHTPHNHFAHLADAWVHGHHWITPGGPSYAQGNDFAEFNGKTYISFPPLPAVLMLPFVALAKSPERFRDAQFIVWLAGAAPALLFLALETLRQGGRSRLREHEHGVLAVLFAFGTVYFFSAVQGTVWFAGHAVGAVVLGAYFVNAIDAKNPFRAGLLVGFAFLTRPTTALAAIFFLTELTASLGGVRMALQDGIKRRNARHSLATFSLPIVVCLGLAAWYNHSRFGTWNPSAFGHEHLTVQWHGRIEKWGLFGYHYLAKNLGCMFTSLPWLPPRGVKAEAPFQINEHGLALWFTSPIYLWLLFRSRAATVAPAGMHTSDDALVEHPTNERAAEQVRLWGLFLSAALPALMNAMYQNSGWQQFGYRFSNDYAIALFLLLAIRAPRLSRLFYIAAAWSVAWNAFGALSFGRRGYEGYYFREGTQSVVYQPD